MPSESAIITSYSSNGNFIWGSYLTDRNSFINAVFVNDGDKIMAVTNEIGNDMGRPLLIAIDSLSGNMLFS